MKSLSKQVAKDITECANVCDTYLKRSSLAKVLMGQTWEVKLTVWVEIFVKRKREFLFCLTLFTAIEGQDTNEIVHGLEHK